MIDPLTQFCFILLCWAVWRIAGGRGTSLILVLGGVAFLVLYAPLAAAWIAFTGVEASLIFAALRNLPRESGWRKFGAYLLLLNLLFVDLHPLVFGLNIETLAISFSTIRIFMTAKQMLSGRKLPTLGDCWWIFAGGFFLPAIVVGPVFSGLDLRDQERGDWKSSVDLRDYRLVLQGLVLAVLVNPAFGIVVEQLTGVEGAGWPLWAGAPYLFLQLFSAFWGQSLIAEHSSRFFGYSLPVNFDAPWKAVTIREFWSRWHRSMAQFVIQYIFLPLNLKGVSPKLATIAAFVFMGLWHNLSLGYAIWGFAHGFLLANWPKAEPAGSMRTLSFVITWVMVISLSYIANFGALS